MPADHRWPAPLLAHPQLRAVYSWPKLFIAGGQYSSASMMVITRSVTDGSVGSGE